MMPDWRDPVSCGNSSSCSGALAGQELVPGTWKERRIGYFGRGHPPSAISLSSTDKSSQLNTMHAQKKLVMVTVEWSVLWMYWYQAVSYFLARRVPFPSLATCSVMSSTYGD